MSMPAGRSALPSPFCVAGLISSSLSAVVLPLRAKPLRRSSSQAGEHGLIQRHALVLVPITRGVRGSLTPLSVMWLTKPYCRHSPVIGEPASASSQKPNVLRFGGRLKSVGTVFSVEGGAGTDEQKDKVGTASEW